MAKRTRTPCLEQMNFDFDRESPSSDSNLYLEQQRFDALYARDMRTYANCCNELGLEVEPELLDDVNPGFSSQEQVWLSSALDKVQKRIDVRKRRENVKHPENYDRLLNVAMESGLIRSYERIAEVADNKKSLEVYSGAIDRMRVQLSDIMGYNRLNIKGGRRVHIGDAKLSRVALVYRDCIQRAKEIQYE